MVGGASVSALQDAQATPLKDGPDNTEATKEEAKSPVTEATKEEAKSPVTEATKEERKSLVAETTLQVVETNSASTLIKTNNQLPTVEVQDSTLVPEQNIAESMSDSNTVTEGTSILLQTADPEPIVEQESGNKTLTDQACSIAPKDTAGHMTDELTNEPSAPNLVSSESTNQIAEPVDLSHVTDLTNVSVVPSAPALLAFSETVQLAPPRESVRGVESEAAPRDSMRGVESEAVSRDSVRGVESEAVSEEMLLYPRLDSILQGNKTKLHHPLNC